MKSQKIINHAVAWLALWSFWVFVSRHNHPNLALNVSASGLLVATFAGAIYANHLWLIPRYRGSPGSYLSALLLCMGGLALLCTILIHVLYDMLWGPDPARFGFGTNLGLEFVLVVFHVAVAALLVRFFRQRQLIR